MLLPCVASSLQDYIRLAVGGMMSLGLGEYSGHARKPTHKPDTPPECPLLQGKPAEGEA